MKIKEIRSGNKKWNQQQIKQKNQQQQRRKPQGYPTFRKYFSPREDRGRLVKFQRNQSHFVPSAHKVKCYSCHNLGML